MTEIKTPIDSLSVIIPVLNEAQNLPNLLKSLKQQQSIELDIVVVDGGSSDGSQSLAESLGARVVMSDKGRAKQLNAGAKAAIHQNLLFVHADSSFDDDALLKTAVDYWNGFNEDNLAGHFSLQFTQSTKRHQSAFRYLAEKSASNRLYTINGDQGLLIRRDFFKQLGGFSEAMPIMEDQIIAKKIFDQGRWIVLPGTLTTSGRRFETEGFHRRYILMSLMMGLYWTGAHQFFDRANNVYVEQKDAERLKLWPFFRCIWQMLYFDLGLKGSIVQWFKVGRYVRQNSWQLFFMLDVVLYKFVGAVRHPFLRFHDKAIKPIISNVFIDALVTPLVFVWFMLILAPYFFLFD